ncbi:MAG: hypothetical protein NVS4B2_21410 [Chloroflexota bacterium]
MSDSRARLLTRKRDLFAAIRLLEQDHDDGVVDDDAYRTARHRYESEAAEILEQIDLLPGDDGLPARRTPLPLRWRSSKLSIAVAVVVTIAALSIVLATALHSRASTAGGVPLVPTPGPQASQQVLRASHHLENHPSSVSAMVALGNAYVQNGQIDAADRTYLAALKIQPSNPDPLTLHAMMLGMAGQYPQGLLVLRDVERSHPTFARAWLLDGLFSSHTRTGSGHAVSAWKHFLALEPRGRVAAQVRGWIAAASKPTSKG